jgi:hypothetical protein
MQSPPHAISYPFAVNFTFFFFSARFTCSI